ncbi:hypothetical protein J4G43_027700 [Bradyrhizobium barranii subsp. barranii]|uniref:Uncharacterized protein n=1 Tax=Bradyrhizobium barranii subsp. barranii TaxID=2823807 RepID=A0A939M8V8_9BRAD|nr:hypothetical protein [Bradyrhizobium barranii]UEM08564.1 hypothetical protein J4G43_027700 [Bradyrhizobium barranii subsp. barranii]
MSADTAKLGDPHPHWSTDAKNESYPKTVEEWDPRKDPVGQHLDLAEKRLRVSIDRDDPRAPAEMALVSRWDLMTLIHDWWHKSAVFDIWRAERAAKVADVSSDVPQESQLTDVLASCKGEHLKFEEWAAGEKYDMHEHPLHYLFIDAKTNAARQGWKAALRYVASTLTRSQSETPTIGSVPSCGKENDYRRAAKDEGRTDREALDRLVPAIGSSKNESLAFGHFYSMRGWNVTWSDKTTQKRDEA